MVMPMHDWLLCIAFCLSVCLSLDKKSDRTIIHISRKKIPFLLVKVIGHVDQGQPKVDYIGRCTHIDVKLPHLLVWTTTTLQKVAKLFDKKEIPFLAAYDGLCIGFLRICIHMREFMRCRVEAKLYCRQECFSSGGIVDNFIECKMR